MIKLINTFLRKEVLNMAFNQINATGSIVVGPNPDLYSTSQLKNMVFNALNKKDYIFQWTDGNKNPFRGVLSTADNDIDVYIYIWNITPAYRTNPSEKRIQIQKAVNNVGILRNISKDEKTVILGVYNSPTGSPIFAAWDAAVNRAHGQKSCYIQVEDLAKVIPMGIIKTKDKNDTPIYALNSEFLAQYIEMLEENNKLKGTSTITNGTSIADKVSQKDLPKRKKRVIKNLEKIKQSIQNLSETEREIIYKQRIGQGLFKELLCNKYNDTCAICDITTPNMLIGSHIKEWSKCSNLEKLDENNGLLLCAHHDALFDKHLISFEDDGSLIISTTLSEKEKATLGLVDELNIDVAEDMKSYLSWHRLKLK